MGMNKINKKPIYPILMEVTGLSSINTGAGCCFIKNAS
jgi:hypothetical protein